MSDIFDRIASKFIREKTASTSVSARSIAETFLSKKSSLTQPLMLRRDYGSREAADFLGTTEPNYMADEFEADLDLEADNAVQVNTGYDEGLDFTGQGNAEDEIVACGEDLYADDLDLEAEFGELEADFIKHSRYTKGEKGSKEYAEAKKSGDVPEEFLEYEGAFDPSTGKMNPARIQKNRGEGGGGGGGNDISALGQLGKSAFMIEDDLGLDRMACGDFSRVADDLEIEDDLGLDRTAGYLHPHYSVLSQLWEVGESSSKGIYGEHSVESLGLTHEEQRSLRSLESKGYIVLLEGVWGPSIKFTKKGVEHYSEMEESHHTHDFRLATDHEESGSYMSLQNINEMDDQIHMLQDSLEEGDHLEDWVEDKISHAHAALSDVSRYIGYGEHGVLNHDDSDDDDSDEDGWEEEGEEDEMVMIDDLSEESEGEIIDDLEMPRFASRTASLRREGAGGLFGYPKSMQKVVEAAIRKLENKREALSRAIETKYPEAGTYFTKRFESSGCNAANALSKSCVFNKVPTRTLGGGLGFKPSCVRACQKSVTDLLLYSGEVAHGLFLKDKDYTPFLQTYAKKKKCPLAKLLLETIPAVPVTPVVEVVEV